MLLDLPVVVTKKERRRMLARERYRRQQARRAARARRRRIINTTIGVVFVVALVAALGWLIKAKVLESESSPPVAPDAVTSIERGMAP